MAQFRDAVGFDGYRVGDDGSVWGRRRHPGNPSGEWREMAGDLDRDGYRRVNLYIEGRLVRRLVHRLVLEAFVGPCPPGMQGCHNNGTRTDNRLCNLRWDTSSGNQRDRFAHGTHLLCERNPRAKLTHADVEAIRESYDRGQSQQAIAKRFGVGQSQISRIIRAQSWKVNR